MKEEIKAIERTMVGIESHIEQLREQLEGLKKPQEPEFVKYKWYKNSGSVMCVTGISSKCRVDGYGYSSFDESWCELDNWFNTKATAYIQATDKEVEAMLIKEAEKRGFKKGVRFDSNQGDQDYNLDQLILGSKISYKNDCLHVSTDKNVSGGTLFYDGKWATIIEETPKYTMSEAIELVGHKFEIKE